MALTGLQIYKLLPKTNCKECGFPTCLAFAMKLAAKQAELSACPHVTEEAKQALAEASAPPIRLVAIGSDEHKVEVGNETVLFRHEKTFYHQPGIMVRVRDNQPLEEIERLVVQVTGYSVDYVGLNLTLNGFAVENASGDPGTYARCVEALRAKSNLPLVLMAKEAKAAEVALAKVGKARPLLYAAEQNNWHALAQLAKSHNCPLAVRDGGDLSVLVDIVEKVKGAGVEDIVLDPGVRGPTESLASLTQIRRLALKQGLRSLGYPIITFPGEGGTTPEQELALAGEHIAKYAGLVVLDRFDPAYVYPLLALRQNIYTDPQKPIQVTPGIYEINSPGPQSPLLVTTNFSITYFSVANEVEGSGVPSWLLIVDTEGLSVLTSWAAGKFDSETIAKAVNASNIAAKLNHKKVTIPGAVAVLSGELEEELAGWDVRVGPREAMDIPRYLREWR